MSDNFISHERDVYDILNLIGDVGGFYGGIAGILSTIVSFTAFLGNTIFESYIVGRIFRNQISEDGDHD